MGNALPIACYWLETFFRAIKVDILVTLVPLLHIVSLLPCARNVGVRSYSEAGETRMTEGIFSWRMMKFARLAGRSTELHSTEPSALCCSSVYHSPLIRLQRAPCYLAWSFSPLKSLDYLEVL